MKTTAIGIENLCVPCHSFCRYCLLSSCGKATGVDYDRGKQFAERLLAEGKEKHPDLRMYYYIGYCMDDVNLLDYIKFSQKTGSPSARFLQFNGLRLRGEKETELVIREVCAAGVEEIDLTFYGTREYHDQFAGRPGDFDFLLRILSAARDHGLTVHVSCPIHKENMLQADELLALFKTCHDGEISFFLPHSKGRGRSLSALRLTEKDFDSLSEKVKSLMGKYRTESEWLSQSELEVPQSRVLTISLKPDNIDQLERMTLDEIISYLEELDDRYYATVPSAAELAERYGCRDGKRLYRRFRDLLLEWQQQFLADSGTAIWDMNDETHHFSIRM